MTLSHEFTPTQTPQRTGAPLHIAFGVSAQYAPAMAVTIISIVANNPHTHLICHVLADSLPPDDIGRLKSLAEQQNVTIRVHDINRQMTSALPDPKEFSYATYYRFQISSLLRGIAQKVLYLDSDIVCLGDISGLSALDMGDAIVAAVVDSASQSPQRMAKIGMAEAAPYFNAGVLYIDLERWNEHDITGKATELLVRRGHQFSAVDQDALNLVLAEKITWMDQRWNRFWNPLRPAPSDTVFLHYSHDKPWHKWSPSFGDPPFVKYLSQSPWPASRLERPVTRKHKKRYARHLLKTGNILGASLWYLNYLATRKTAGKV